MSCQCARFPREIKSSSALQDSKMDGRGTKPGSGWLKDYVHRGEMAHKKWLRISFGKEHGQGPNLCSMKLGVVICGEVIASPGFALFISKRSKESETGCSHLDPSAAQPPDPCQTLQRSRVRLCLGLRLHLQRCSDATLLRLILDAHTLVVQPTAQNKVFL